MTAVELRTLAPRLCAAYDGLLDTLDLAIHQNRIAGDELLSADRCLAHRQLQLVRAGTKKSAKYNLERHRKLREIEQRRDLAVRTAAARRSELDRARAAVRAVDDPVPHHELRSVAA